MDKPVDACGVFGIYSKRPNVSSRVYAGCEKLGHRGQESYGIATFSEPERRIVINRKLGHVSNGFNAVEIDQLDGFFGGGHVRYSTRGASDIHHAQPFYFKSPNFGEFALMHNGTIRNAEEIRKNLISNHGVKEKDFNSASDTEVAGRLICQGKDVIDGLKLASKEMLGSYSFLIVDKNGLYAVRDPWGIKPLCIGNMEGDTAISSESCAFGSNRNLVRDVERGEIYHMGRDGEWSESLGQKQRALDIFELVYFALPSSIIDGIPVANFRMRIGRKLARRDMESGLLDNLDRLVAFGVELSGKSFGEGYAYESKVPLISYEIRLITGRSFIQPSQALRQSVAERKWEFIESLVPEYGNRIILLDDSVVRSITMRAKIKKMREGGIKEIHLRSGFLPVVDTCPYGIDMKTKEEQFANQYPQERWASELSVDSLMYSRLEDLIESANAVSINGKNWGANDFCTRCVTGIDPQEEELRKTEGKALQV